MTIYARQIAPEHQESPLFWGAEFWPYGLIADGNRDYNSHTTSIYQHITRHFDEMAGAWENDGSFYEWDGDSRTYIERSKKREYTVAEILRDYGFTRADGKPWTTREKHQWRLLMEFDGYPDYDHIILGALHLMTGKEWATTTIHGCCQGDWQSVYYIVEEWPGDSLQAFETEYFNTGTEWIVHDEADEPESPEDICGFSVYCHGWRDEDIRAEIADAAGGNAEDVILYEFSGWNRSAVYKEVC